MTGAVARDGVILCAAHGKKLGRVTREGVELWCRAGKHPAVIGWEELLAAREKAERNG